MGQPLTHQLSPLAQASRQGCVKLPTTTRGLSVEDQRELARLLQTELDYVDSDVFHSPDAARRVFDEAPDIPTPDTSWYHPVMDGQTAKAARNVSGILLTARQEQALFLQFNYCRYQLVELRKTVGNSEPGMVVARHMLEWARRAAEYRDQIAQTNLALVLAMAKRTRMTEVDFSDLISEGNMALLRAIDKFDVSRGFKFSTYACRAILKAFSRSGVKLSRYRQMFPTDFDPKLERSDHAERQREEHEADCADELRHIVDDNLAHLTDIEEQVIRRRFALNEQQARPSDRPLTLEQVGRIIGVTKERVRQIQNKALTKIRHTLDDKYL